MRNPSVAVGRTTTRPTAAVAGTRAPGGARAAVGGAAYSRALDSLGRWERLDPAADRVRRVVRALPLGPVRDVLHGRPLGHPLHPTLVQVPMGAWLSAAVLDLVPATGPAAGTLVAVGITAALPAAASGWVDFAEQHPQQQRTGLVHAAANLTAVALYGASLAARLTGRTRLGKALGWAGLSAAGLGGMLGGHLAYRQAAGANKAEPVEHLLSPDWHRLGALADFPAGEAAAAQIGEVSLVVVRSAGDAAADVLANRCSHASGPLAEGAVAEGCVTCPWHGSVFRLSDGWNVEGPATAPQPRFETRVTQDGMLEVRLPHAG